MSFKRYTIKTGNFEKKKKTFNNPAIVSSQFGKVDKMVVINNASSFYLLTEHKLEYFNESGNTQNNYFCDNHIQFNTRCCHLSVFINKRGIRTRHIRRLEFLAKLLQHRFQNLTELSWTSFITRVKQVNKQKLDDNGRLTSFRLKASRPILIYCS